MNVDIDAIDVESESSASELDNETLQNTIVNRMAPAQTAAQQTALRMPPPTASARRNRISFADKSTQPTDTASVQSISADSANGNSANGFAEAAVSKPPSAAPPLAHMAPSCAGLHGADSRTLVERRSFAELFAGEAPAALFDFLHSTVFIMLQNAIALSFLCFSAPIAGARRPPCRRGGATLPTARATAAARSC